MAMAPISGVPSIMMEKSAQSGEVGGCTPTLFHYIYHHIQKCGVRSSWKGKFTLPLFLLYPYIYSMEDKEMILI